MSVPVWWSNIFVTAPIEIHFHGNGMDIGNHTISNQRISSFIGSFYFLQSFLISSSFLFNYLFKKEDILRLCRIAFQDEPWSHHLSITDCFVDLCIARQGIDCGLLNSGWAAAVMSIATKPIFLIDSSCGNTCSISAHNKMTENSCWLAGEPFYWLEDQTKGCCCIF